ncbi:hypothetical protein [Micromonospora sp. NPDC005299]|uniref:hypothetical protein n=1 Tax=Micromonospora sp. NPDC005299 TaxID=3364231 RepID=UPI00369EF24B
MFEKMAWLTPEESAELCRRALSRVESSVEFLDRELADNRPEALSWWAERSRSDRELDWQGADLRALREMSDSERA